MLVTTKPHLQVIEAICELFASFKDSIQFRFTITSIDNATLKQWEPGAPPFEERLEALQHAYAAGFKTSISIEPCLDADPRPLVALLRSFVTESIWLGSMNYCGTHEFNAKETLVRWLSWFQDDPLIRFKDSVHKKLESYISTIDKNS